MAQPANASQSPRLKPPIPLWSKNIVSTIIQVTLSVSKRFASDLVHPSSASCCSKTFHVTHLPGSVPRQSISNLQTLQTSSDLKTSACCTAKAPPKEVLEVLKQLPHEIISKYYGCGSPFPRGLKGSGLRVLDLGCGSGRDCYVCAALVGENGFVTGEQQQQQQC